MLEQLFGSQSREKVLIYLLIRTDGYAREIARFFDIDLTPIQKQLERLELGNIIYCRKIGRTKLYSFNPRYPFLNELKTLLEKAFSFYPTEIRNDLLKNRRRPRRAGKPI
ncbi:MAG: winged helix-turn-helix transcriptional regulator [Fibrobacteres bacterium]|nr:winged helix-turn-helix transcriptional regulator [Fibrobacterota bacterium]